MSLPVPPIADSDMCCGNVDHPTVAGVWLTWFIGSEEKVFITVQHSCSLNYFYLQKISLSCT